MKTLNRGRQQTYKRQVLNLWFYKLNTDFPEPPCRLTLYDDWENNSSLTTLLFPKVVSGEISIEKRVINMDFSSLEILIKFI